MMVQYIGGPISSQLKLVENQRNFGVSLSSGSIIGKESFKISLAY
jgi:hypothetical protein